MKSFADFLKEIKSKNLVAYIYTHSAYSFTCPDQATIEEVLSDCVVFKTGDRRVVIPFSAIRCIVFHL